jgi:hypothetical protein
MIFNFLVEQMSALTNQTWARLTLQFRHKLLQFKDQWVTSLNYLVKYIIVVGNCLKIEIFCSKFWTAKLNEFLSEVSES